MTGNPRVLNTRTVLTHLQAVEFSATIGVQRRGDAIWGRLMTFSGLCTLLRREAVLSLGGFAPTMATEDIDLTWRLELAGWEAQYEPRALFGMQAPETWRAFLRQRRRWSLGLAQVLREHTGEALRLRNWRLWPVLVQSSLSILWAHLLVLFTGLLLIAELVGDPPHGLTAFLGLFAAVVLTAGTAQVATGILLDQQSDPGIWGQVYFAAWYPAAYWIVSTLIVVWGTLPGLLRRPKGVSTWDVPREPEAIVPTAAE